MENNVPKPDNYLVWAILSTLFCCLPLGILAIIHSTKVDSLYFSGNYNAAQEEANEAKKWTNYSAIIGIIFYVVSIVLGIIVGIFDN